MTLPKDRGRTIRSVSPSLNPDAEIGSSGGVGNGVSLASLTVSDYNVLTSV